jgi:hypothetical protein
VCIGEGILVASTSKLKHGLLMKVYSLYLEKMEKFPIDVVPKVGILYVFEWSKWKNVATVVG